MNNQYIRWIALCIAGSIVYHVNAQLHQWIRTNPGGGGAFSTIGAGIDGTIIAASDLSGAYRSQDGGSTWDVLGASRGLTETHISGIGFHRTIPDILFIGTGNGIFRSNNGGDSFTHVLTSGYITDIEMAVNQPNIGYATYHPTYNSKHGTIYKTTDTGWTWSPITTNLPDSLRLLKIVVNPHHADTLYVLSGNGRFACGPAEVYRSTDGGISWTHLTDSFPPILDLAMDPQHPDTLYISTMNADCNATYYWTDLLGALYRSTDAGISWTYRSDYTGVILINPNNTSHIRIIDPREPYPWNPRSGTFTSYDGGLSFTQTGSVNQWDTFFQSHVYWCYGSSFNGICKTVGEDLSNPNTYYWVTSQWAYKSTNGGTTFENIFTREIQPGYWQSRGLDNVNMMDIAISPADPRIIYAAYFDIGLWRSIDKGQSWQSCNDSLHSGNWEGHGGNCATVLADPQRPHVVWASQSENQNGEYPTYLLKNSDTGNKNQWIPADTGLPKQQIMGLSIDPQSPTHHRTLYVTAQQDVYQSTNDGTSWTKIFDCNGCRFTAVDPNNRNILYAAGERGVWRSTDRGNSWTNISIPEMYAPAGSQFWDWGYSGIFDLATDPHQSGVVYVVVHGPNKGLYKSTDTGKTWAHILTDNFLRKVAIVPTNTRQIYATSSSAFEAGGYDTGSHGIWYSHDGGQTWTRQNHGMPYPFALAVAIDHSTQPTVYVGVPGTGLQKAAVPIPVSTTTSSTFTAKAYPNPTSRYLHVVLRSSPSKPISLYDITGRIHPVPYYLIDPYHYLIDLSGLPAGTYLLKFTGKPQRIYKTSPKQ